MKFFLQKLSTQFGPTSVDNRNNVFLLYSPSERLAFMIREKKPLQSFISRGCRLTFVRHVSPSKGKVATLSDIVYPDALSDKTENVLGRTMHIHAGKDYTWSEGCFLPVPYESVGEMLANRKAESFDLTASRELAQLWYERAPFTINIIGVALALTSSHEQEQSSC